MLESYRINTAFLSKKKTGLQISW